MTSRNASGSRASANAVELTMSAKSTVTVLRTWPVVMAGSMRRAARRSSCSETGGEPRSGGSAPDSNRSRDRIDELLALGAGAGSRRGGQLREELLDPSERRSVVVEHAEAV